MVEPLEPVLVIGASGMLARAFALALDRRGAKFVAIDVPDVDLRDPASIERAVAPEYRTVLNCAAYTDVDGAETNEAVATAINGTGVGALAARCEQTGALLVHYSTDYVFAGDAEEPYKVDEARAPLNAYGRSKAEGELLIERSGARHLLLRTSWLYAPWGKNFVLTMRELTRTKDAINVVADQVGRPTSAEYLALRTLALIEAGATGTFHVTDGGQCSWHEFASTIAQLTGSQCRVDPCTSAEFVRPARRPAYSVLDLAPTEALIGPSRPWQENLRAVLEAVRMAEARANPT
jgi:dTDP-4-dehydrorhamnose reductase